MPRVFVTQLPSRLEDGVWVPSVDVSPAKEFGELVFVIPPGLNHPTADTVIQQLRDRLHDFNSVEDFLLPMGDPVIMAAASALLGRRTSWFRLLKWDRITRRYNVFEIETL